MYDTDSDSELIRLARRGDRGAFSALYARHGKAVYFYALTALTEIPQFCSLKFPTLGRSVA